jgi:methylglutaconyl-CoA hydratase
MNWQTISISIDDRGVATLRLARPQKHNSLSSQMIGELTKAAGELSADPSVRAVILTGEGESFCAGGDLEWMRSQFSASRQERIAEAMKLAGMLRALNEMAKPLIGRVNGQAYGGGLGMMSVCDLAIVSSQARFGFTETRLGLIPATIGPYVIARMGEGHARRVFMSARIFGADEAVAMGLAARSVEPDDLDAATDAEVKPYLSCSPQAVAAAKALARRLGPPIDDAIIADTVSWLADTWETADAAEGVGAFFDKRKPGWAQR